MLRKRRRKIVCFDHIYIPIALVFPPKDRELRHNYWGTKDAWEWTSAMDLPNKIENDNSQPLES